MFSNIRQAFGLGHMGGGYRINATGISDVGKDRKSNEDRFCILTPPEIIRSVDSLLLLGDGMGGHAGGQTAANIGVGTLK